MARLPFLPISSIRPPVELPSGKKRIAPWLAPVISDLPVTRVMPIFLGKLSRVPLAPDTRAYDGCEQFDIYLDQDRPGGGSVL